MRTEASARYERGVNPAELKLASDRALQLLIEIAGATFTGQAEDRTKVGNITPTREVPLRLSHINQILGKVTDRGEAAQYLDSNTIETLLEKLGCKATATSEGLWNVEVPPYRYRDLEREIDLIEEVARLYGYDSFDYTLPSQTSRGYLSADALLSRKLPRCLPSPPDSLNLFTIRLPALTQSSRWFLLTRCLLSIRPLELIC